MLWDEDTQKYKAQRISPKGSQFIADFEGLKLQAYKCPAGVWTIGWGHTGPDVKEGMEITKEQADQLLEKDISAKAEKYVNALPPYVVLQQHQYDALCSLVYNCGPAAIAKDSTIRKALCSGDFEKAAAGFLSWCKITDPKTKQKKVCKGLLARREIEKKLFEGLYEW